jgi:hypothetical protein
VKRLLRWRHAAGVGTLPRYSTCCVGSVRRLNRRLGRLGQRAQLVRGPRQLRAGEELQGEHREHRVGGHLNAQREPEPHAHARPGRARADRAAAELVVLSRPHDTLWRLSVEKATDSTSLLCPTKRLVVAPVLRSHSRSVASHEHDSANCPSELTTTSSTK